MKKPDTPAKGKVQAALEWVRTHIPPGLRLILGVLCIIGGVFGVLPILGFWMIPLGIAIVGLDIKPLYRKFKNRKK
jgi:hypothetical protein